MALPKATASEKALKLRKRVKAKKPNFVRQESWKYIRLKENWRRPHGLDNKVRKRFKGWPARVSAGYRGPKSARALHPSGFEDVLVYNVDDLKQIDATTQAVRIAHAVGQRKRIQILTEARKKKIVVLNQRQVKEATKKEEESTEETEKDEAETEEANNTEKPTEEKKVSKPKKRTE
ncbi:MAG: 50S ribosomal protein L32e [Candidatus Bathyarchaeia archaeon]|jgi:large subunit ribosomal protein L32e